MFQEGAQFRPFIQDGEWYRAVTAMFLHGGLTHVAFNMYALYLFGPSLERRFGSIPFATLYLATGLGEAPSSTSSGATSRGRSLRGDLRALRRPAGRLIPTAAHNRRTGRLLPVGDAAPHQPGAAAVRASGSPGKRTSGAWRSGWRWPRCGIGCLGGAAGVARRTAITAAFGAVAMAIILIV